MDSTPLIKSTMNYTETIQTEDISTALRRLAIQYKSYITILGDYEQAGTEAIYHHQLILQAIEDALNKIAVDSDESHSVYNELIQKYNIVPM